MGQESNFTFSYTEAERQGSGSQAGVAYSGGFKGHAMGTNQQINFNIIDRTENAIEGTYMSINPRDNGRFFISKI